MSPIHDRSASPDQDTLDRLEAELLESPEGDLSREDLAMVLAALANGPPVVTPPGQVARTAELVAALPVPGAFRRRMILESASRPRGFGSALELVRGQMPVFSRSFWGAAALVMLIATLTTYGLLAEAVAPQAGRLGALALPLAVSSPVLAALGVSYSLRSLGGGGPWEVELSCPITPVSMAVGRLVIVVTYVTGLALVASLVLWGRAGAGAGLGMLWHTVEAWLFPVLFLASLSFYLAVRLSPVIAAAVPVALWAVQLIMRQVQVDWSVLALPGEASGAMTPWLMTALSALLLVAAVRASLGLAERGEGGSD